MKRSGQGLVEYAVLLAAIAILAIGGLTLLGGGVGGAIFRVGDSMAAPGAPTATPCAGPGNSCFGHSHQP